MSNNLLQDLNQRFGAQVNTLMPALEGVDLTQLTKTQMPVHAWIHQYPHHSPGGLYRVNEKGTYTMTPTGTRVAIKRITLDLNGHFDAGEHNVTCIALDEEGRLVHPDDEFTISVDHLDPLSPEETAKIEYLWAQPVPEPPEFKDGTVVELVRGTNLVFNTMTGKATKKLPKGLYGIIDTPDQSHGRNLDEANRTEFTPPTKMVQFGWRVSNTMSAGYLDPSPIGGKFEEFIRRQPRWFTPTFQHKEIPVPVSGHGWNYNVYFPSLRTHTEIGHSNLVEHQFDDQALDNLVLDGHIKKKLLFACKGQIEDKFEIGSNKVGSSSSRIVVAFGDAGLGKTHSAKAVAEVLHRPIIMVDAQNLGNTPEEFEEGLTNMLKRGQRWGAIVLWDEGETYLRAREKGAPTNKMAATALSLFEQFEVTMIITTNQASDLDGAILSRAAQKLLYPEFTDEQRQEVIRLKVPTRVVPELESVINELAKFPLTGRDIEKILQGAADIAAGEGLDSVPAGYLVKEAKYMMQMNEQIHGTQQHTFGTFNRRDRLDNGHASNGAHATA